MKIAVFETEEWEHRGCLRLQPANEVTCTEDPLNRETAGPFSASEIISTFVNSTLSGEVLSKFPGLRFIATRSTGFDHIDLSYCQEHGIIVSNVPDYGDATVAEHTFALLLSLARHLVEAATRTRHGDFSQAGLRGFELRGRCLGVIGTGRIGRRVIEIARGFGMEVAAFDLHPEPVWADLARIRYAALDDVLAASDIVTLHVPASPATKNLISDRELALMKSDAVLINTARGNVVDVPALVRHLSQGKLRGVALDVLPQEPLIREEAQIFRIPAGSYDLPALVGSHVLATNPRVLVSPHIAYNTEEAVQKIINTTLVNIEAFLRGEPRNLVTGRGRA